MNDNKKYCSVLLRGKTYLWDGRDWFDSNYLSVPTTMWPELMKLLQNEQIEEMRECRKESVIHKHLEQRNKARRTETSKLQEEFDFCQCWGTAEAADRFKFYHERGVGLPLVDAENALEEALENLECLRARWRRARCNGWRTDGIEAAGKAARDWLDFCEYQADQLDRQLVFLDEDDEVFTEHPVLQVLRGHYCSVKNGRVKYTSKLGGWLIALLAWLDDEVCELTFDEKLAARVGATLILRMITQHPSWIAEVDSSRSALAKVKQNNEVLDPGARVFGNPLSTTEDAMVGLLDIKRDADKMVNALGISYETAVLSLVDPD